MLKHYVYDFDFPIVRKKRKLFSRILRWTFFISALSSIISFRFLDYKTENIFLLIVLKAPVIIFMVSFLTLIFYSNLAKNFVINGQAFINRDHIQITINKQKKEYPLSEVKNITIRFYGSEGDPIPGNPRSMVFKEGTNNFLEFEDIADEQHVYELYVEKEVRLKQCIMTMKERNIPFTTTGKQKNQSFF